MRPKNTKCFSRRIPPATFGDFGSLQSHSPQGAKSPIPRPARRRNSKTFPDMPGDGRLQGPPLRKSANLLRRADDDIGPYGGKQLGRRADHIRPYGKQRTGYNPARRAGLGPAPTGWKNRGRQTAGGHRPPLQKKFPLNQGGQGNKIAH